MYPVTLQDVLKGKANVRDALYHHPDGFRIIIEKCPWLDLMVKSGREALADKVGTTICNTDYATFAAEFGDDIRFELQHQLCSGSELCVLQFSQ